MSYLSRSSLPDHPRRARILVLIDYPAPHMLRLCEALAEKVQVKFLFYTSSDRSRPAWWLEGLPEHAVVLPRSPLSFGRRYLSTVAIAELRSFDPDVLIFGGLSIPGNCLAYLWARLNQKVTVGLTERSRDRRGNLRRRSLAWTLLRTLYAELDLLMVTHEDVVPQMRDDFRFGDKVAVGRYAADFRSLTDDPPREVGDAPRLLFANRLIEIYNPLMALRVFRRILDTYPSATLQLNAEGPLRSHCEAEIIRLGLSGKATFLEQISSWADLDRIYLNSHILLLPATFSNGNFSVLEAMASGVAVVLSNQVMGMGDVVVPGTSALVTELDDFAMASAVMDLVQQPDRFKRITDDARTRIVPYTARATAERWLTILADRGLILAGPE